MKVREIAVDGDVARVVLTRGYVATIDAGDVSFVAGWNWTAMPVGRTCYARRSDWATGSNVLLHRVIMNASQDQHVDHINGDGLDCRRVNLRFVTHMQNCWNAAQRRSRLGVRGVRQHSNCRKFVSEITAGGVRHYLGIFDTVEAAQAAYAEAKKRLHHGYGSTR